MTWKNDIEDLKNLRENCLLELKSYAENYNKDLKDKNIEFNIDHDNGVLNLSIQEAHQFRIMKHISEFGIYVETIDNKIFLVLVDISYNGGSAILKLRSGYDAKKFKKNIWFYDIDLNNSFWLSNPNNLSN